MTLPRRHAPTVRRRRVRTSAIALFSLAAVVTGCSLWTQGTTDQPTAATTPDASSGRAKELAALTKVLGITDPLQTGIRNNQFEDPPNDITAAPTSTLPPGAAPTASSSSTTAKEPEGRVPFATRFTLDLARHGAFRHDVGAGRDALFGVGGKLACGARGDLDGSPYAVLCPWAGAPDGAVFWFVAATNMDLPERALDPASTTKPTQRFFQFVALSCPVFTDAPLEPGSIGVTLSGSGPTGEVLGTNRYELRLSPDVSSSDESTTTLVKPPPTTKPKYPCTPHETAARAALIGRTLAIGVPAREIYASTLAWHFGTTGLVAGKAMGDVTEDHNSYVDESGNKLETTPLTLATTTTSAPKTTTTVDPNASSTTTSINLMPDGTFAPSTTTEPPTTTASTSTTSAPTTTASSSTTTTAPP